MERGFNNYYSIYKEGTNMNWSTIHALTLGLSFGTFGFLYLLVLVKGIPEVLKTMKENHKKED